jgi:CheY-like chemotaxis protein
MPDTDGIDLLKEIRGRKEGLKQPYFVLLTGGTTQRFEAGPVSQLIDGCILKPVDMDYAYNLFSKLAHRLANE